MSLIIGHDGTEVGIGVADMDYRGIAALDVDRRGSGGAGDNGRDQVVAAVFLYRKRQKLKKVMFSLTHPAHCVSDFLRGRGTYDARVSTNTRQPSLHRYSSYGCRFDF